MTAAIQYETCFNANVIWPFLEAIKQNQHEKELTKNGPKYFFSEKKLKKSSAVDL